MDQLAPRVRYAGRIDPPHTWIDMRDFAHTGETHMHTTTRNMKYTPEEMELDRIASYCLARGYPNFPILYQCMDTRPNTV